MLLLYFWLFYFELLLFCCFYLLNKTLLINYCAWHYALRIWLYKLAACYFLWVFYVVSWFFPRIYHLAGIRFGLYPNLHNILNQVINFFLHFFIDILQCCSTEHSYIVSHQIVNMDIAQTCQYYDIPHLMQMHLFYMLAVS